MENQRLRSPLVLEMAKMREDDDEGDESTAPFDTLSPLNATSSLDCRFNGGEKFDS